jgi:hypothetical protein
VYALAYYVLRYAQEFFLTGVKTVKETVISLEPDIAFAVLIDEVNAATGYLAVIAGMGFIWREVMAIELIKSVPCAKPQEAFAVLNDTGNGILRQTIVDGKMTKTIANLCYGA